MHSWFSGLVSFGSRRSIVVLAVLGVCMGLAILTIARGYFERVALTETRNRSVLFQSTLSDALDKYRYLPMVLADDPLILAALENRASPHINARLATIAERTGIEAIYVMDPTGLTIAASNYQKPGSFLGENYGFRPYFREAMRGDLGEFFAIGATTSRPGYFIAEGVRAPGGAIVGVLALKLDLAPLIQAWSRTGEVVFVSNADDVVFLSSDQSLRYRALSPIDDFRIDEIAAERQFGGHLLAPLDWREMGANRAELDGVVYQHVTARVSDIGWTLHLLHDTARANEQAWLVVIAAAVVIVILMALSLYLRSERIRSALVSSQHDRRALQLANAELRRAQAELERNSKLAALGQLSASVTHELGQPISAMRNYLTAAEMNDESLTLLAPFRRIVDRMEGITRQLRFFASPNKEPMRRLDLRVVVDEARALVLHDVERHDVDLEIASPDQPLLIDGNALRLEQVVVNLFRNAIAAMVESEYRCLRVTFEADRANVRFHVSDTGHGVNGETIEVLQEPFHTTRSSGDGMGLGLSISAAILREHGGALEVAPGANCGSVFTVCLPRASEESS